MIVFDTDWNYQFNSTFDNAFYLKAVENEIYYSTEVYGVRKTSIFANGENLENFTISAQSNLTGTFRGVDYGEKNDIIIASFNSDDKICYFYRNLSLIHCSTLSVKPRCSAFYEDKIYIGTAPIKLLL